MAAKPAQDLTPREPAQNRERVGMMMREMLADRFQLRLHAETLTKAIYKLQPATAGVKLKEVGPPVSPAKEGNVGAALLSDGGVRIVAIKVTMASLASALNLLTGKKIVDDTGLNGYYDFDVKWNGPELIGLLISNLQSQFGLRLVNAAGPVEYWIVDHVQPPSSN